MSMPQNNYLIVFLKLCFLLFLMACSDNGKHPEPLYDTKQVYRPFTFGPGIHSEVVIYNKVRGWVGGQEPDWVFCQSLGLHYSKKIEEHAHFSNENVKIYLFYGTTWISSFIVSDDPKDTIFQITEWDDHSNYEATDIENFVKVICQKR